MCQPLPLGRCITGASTELIKAQLELGDAVMGRIEARREYEAGAAAYAELFNRAEGDEPDLEKFWNDAHSAMDKMSDANMRVMTAERERNQKQLLVDATDTGLKRLKEDPNVENRSLRIKNAEDQRGWTERIRTAVKAESKDPSVSSVALESHKEVLYGRMLQEETANYEASQELERRYSGSATSLADSIEKMEKEDIPNKDEQIEALVKIKKDDLQKSTRHAFEMAMHSARIKDLTAAIREINSSSQRSN